MLFLEIFLLFCIYVCGFNSVAGVIFVWLVIIPKIVMVIMAYNAEKHPPKWSSPTEKARHEYKIGMTEKFGKCHNWNDPEIRKLFEESFHGMHRVDDEYWSD